MVNIYLPKLYGMLQKFLFGKEMPRNITLRLADYAFNDDIITGLKGNQWRAIKILSICSHQYILSRNQHNIKEPQDSC
jgi:hypothetical protein